MTHADRPGDNLHTAAAAYTAAHQHLQTTATKARAASQAHTDAQRTARNAPDWLRTKAWADAAAAKETMGRAWKAAQHAMHAEWEAKDALAAAALAVGQLTVDEAA